VKNGFRIEGIDFPDHHLLEVEKGLFIEAVHDRSFARGYGLQAARPVIERQHDTFKLCLVKALREAADDAGNLARDPLVGAAFNRIKPKSRKRHGE